MIRLSWLEKITIGSELCLCLVSIPAIASAFSQLPNRRLKVTSSNYSTKKQVQLIVSTILSLFTIKIAIKVTSSLWIPHRRNTDKHQHSAMLMQCFNFQNVSICFNLISTYLFVCFCCFPCDSLDRYSSVPAISQYRNLNQ